MAPNISGISHPSGGCGETVLHFKIGILPLKWETKNFRSGYLFKTPSKTKNAKLSKNSTFGGSPMLKLAQSSQFSAPFSWKVQLYRVNHYCIIRISKNVGFVKQQMFFFHIPLYGTTSLPKMRILFSMVFATERALLFPILFLSQ